MSVVPELSGPVRAALAAGRPVVALESTIISHGLPLPRVLPHRLGRRPGTVNLDIARSNIALAAQIAIAWSERAAAGA